MAVQDLKVGTQRVGTFGYKMEVRIPDFGDLTGATLRVRIQRPDGSTFDRTTTAAEVTLAESSTESEPVLEVEVKTGDWTETGEYKALVFDETGGGNRSSGYGYFYVGPSLPAPAP